MAPVLVKALEGREVTLVRPGQHHTLFLTRTGELLSVGRPTYGRLGRPGIDTASDEAVAEPGTVQIENGGSIAGLAAGVWRSCCLALGLLLWRMMAMGRCVACLCHHACMNPARESLTAKVGS